ncbi:MAG TPA: LacI family DNA-binding transcriptional regulator [Ktedonosporobacter sp.]|nr:LacI family DNA-binding transcriptional regulator [Ktedonosporobacter sp.]
MPVTIHDIAQSAGVSVGTVSRVINNSPGVKQGTRERVLAVIAQLQYRPDPIARSMVSKRTGSVGVIVPFFTRPFFMEVLQGIEAAIAEDRRDLVLYNVENDIQRHRYFSEVPMRRRVDGLLILSLTPDEAAARHLREIGLPTVLVDGYSPLHTSLVVDNIDGAYQAMQCLIRRGHQRIGFIIGLIDGTFQFNQANDRLIGVHRALGEAGILFEPELIVTADWTRQGGKSAALHLLALKHRPTAIFAGSDMQAIGVLNAANALGIRVPEELAIIGFDGIEVSELLDLSTMQQPMRHMGALGVYHLIRQMHNPEQPPELIRLSTTLVERRTTDPGHHLAAPSV